MSLEKVLEHFQRERQQLTDYYGWKMAELDEVISEVRLCMNHNDAAPAESHEGRNLGLSSEVQSSGGHVEVRPGQWKGWEIAAALQAYLAQKHGGAKLEAEVMGVLRLAEVKLGRKDREVRNVRITISMNWDKFKYDKKTDWVELKGESDSHQP